MIKMPPDLVLESTCGKLLCEKKYQEYALINASSLLNTLESHNLKLSENINILDFGCGTGRITGVARGLCKSNLFGTDRNIEHIAYAKKYNGNRIDYHVNSNQPPLHFVSSYFDVVFSFSVFTHFSYLSFVSWIEEIYRILKPNGLFIISLRGIPYYEALTCDQLLDLETVGFYEEKNESEFRNNFNLYMSRGKIYECFNDFDILELQESPVNFSPRPKKYIQDVWILRKANA